MNDRGKVLLAIVFFTLSANQITAQVEESFKEMYIEAESYFLFEEFKDALPIYQKILQSDPDNYNINYKIGICYLNDPYQVQKSIGYLEKAVKGTSVDYRANNYRERMAPMEALYYLGHAYRVNYRLEEAVGIYEQFKSVLDPVVYDIELVDMQINVCKVAMNQIGHPMFFTSVNQGELINEQSEELNPVVSGDESAIAFTRRLPFYDAVFYSRKENGSWSTPVNLTPFFGVDGSTYTTGISYSGDELYLYRSDDFDGNIYVSRLINGTWSRIEKLNDNINTKYWESHASISKDGRTLYFTSNRRGGYGGLDIYKSERKDGGDWGPAVNMGPVINSRYNEDTPFITDDGSTLYFSSMGHYTMGGYDIFYSTRLDNGQWAIPINAGYPLNTTNDDLFFVPLHDGAFAYASRYNEGDSRGLADIYKMEVFTALHPRKFILRGLARQEGEIRADYPQYTARLINRSDNQVFDQALLNPDGTFELDATSGDFELQISGEGIKTSSENITIPANSPSATITHSTTLVPDIRAEAAETIPQEEVGAEPPRLETSSRYYNVTSGEAIPIQLELDRNTRLELELSLDDELLKTESFDINQRRFLYMLTPLPGRNLLHFSATDEDGNSNTLDVVVVYTPTEKETEAVLPVEQAVLSDTGRYQGIASLATGNLSTYLQSPVLQGMEFGSTWELYDHLNAHADENGFTAQEVDQLITRFLAQKDLEYFENELQRYAGDSLRMVLERLDLKESSIYTSEGLVTYLSAQADSAAYSPEDLRETLLRIASLERDPLAFIELLQSHATGDLASLLEGMKENLQAFPDTRSVVDFLMRALESRQFTIADIEDLLEKAAYELDVNFLYQSLLFISSDSLRNALVRADLQELDIFNAGEFITYLLGESEPGGYTRKEVIDNVEKIRKDPYYYVELFRDLLAEKATGALKEFIREIDVRGLEINTYEELLNYLLNQSQYHAFNREMIYQLLLDIIDIPDVGEFISYLLRYANDRILAALQATDLEQFSKPIEVVRYLLEAAGNYGYTEQDILRLLLKILLERKPFDAALTEKKGWLAHVDKPVLIKSLIVVNTIIIILLILLLYRRKKRDKDLTG